MTEISEKEIEAAREAWREYWSDVIGQYDDNKGPMEGMRRALEAAARVRAEGNSVAGSEGTENSFILRAVGDIEDLADDLKGDRGVILEGSAEAIREAGKLWGERVRIIAASAHPAPQPSGPVEDLLDEGLEILNALIDNIKRCGNYSPDATCTFIDQAGQCLREALSALTSSKPEQVPSGWKLVPEEPTEEMYRAVYKVQDDCAIHNYGASPTFDDYWSAALSASPAAPTAGGSDA